MRLYASTSTRIFLVWTDSQVRVICRYRNILYAELMDFTGEGGPSLFLWDMSSKRAAEGRNRYKESPDAAASAETWSWQARPRGPEVKPNFPVSLCVAVWSEAWASGMLSPSCALCPGTAVRLRGTLVQALQAIRETHSLHELAQ